MNNNENNNFGLGDFEPVDNQSLANNQNMNNTISNSVPDNNGMNPFGNGITIPSNGNQVNHNQFGSMNSQPQVSDMNQVNGVGQQTFPNNQGQMNNMSMNGGSVNSLNTMDAMNQQAGVNTLNTVNSMNQQVGTSMMGQSTMFNQALENPANQGIQGNVANDMNQTNPMQASQNIMFNNNMTNMGNGGMPINNGTVSSANQISSTINNKIQAILKNNGKYILIGVVIVVLIFLAISFAKNVVGSSDSSLKKNEKLLATCSKDSSEGGLNSTIVYKVILNKDYIDSNGLKLLRELHFYTQKDITDEQLEQVKEIYTAGILEISIACPDGNQTGDIGCDTKVYKVNNREFVVSGYTYKLTYHLDQKDNMIQELKDAGYTCK